MPVLLSNQTRIGVSVAFTKQPVNSTYTTKFIPLIREINSRGSTNNKDEYYTNCFPESVKNKLTNDKELNLIKRSGSQQFIAAGGTGVLRGLFNWKDQNKLFKVVGRDCFVFDTTAGTLITTLTNIVGTGTTPVGMCLYLYDTNVVKVVITDGTTLSTIDIANVVVVSADADLPVPHIPHPVFFDGYLLLVKSATADCYNSDLNDPLSWTPGNFITAEMRAAPVIDLITLNNYFLLLTNASIEYFWDAGNAVGTPFQRNDTPVKLVGYIGGLAQFGNKIYIIAEEVEGEPNVFILEDFKIIPVGNEAIRRHLSSVSLSTVTGNIISIDGNDMYVVDTGAATYFMVLETRLWGLLQYQNQTRFPMNVSVASNQTVGNATLFTLQGDTAIHKFSPTLYQDNGINFTTTIVTDATMFDTWSNKFMNTLIPWCDRTSADANLDISWTDDDYQTYNTPRSVNLNQERPDLPMLGRFRKRAFKLQYTTNQPLRTSKLEVDLNMGIA